MTRALAPACLLVMFVMGACNASQAIPSVVTCPGGTRLVRGPGGATLVYKEWCETDDGVREGPFLFRQAMGGVLGYYRRGLTDGTFTQWSPKTGRIVGTYSMSQGTGDYVLWSPSTDRKVLAGRMVGDKRDGTWTRWNDAGDLLGTFEMRAGTGVEIDWFDDGRKRTEKSWVDGELDGPARYWNHDGSLVGEEHYRRGKKID